MLSKLEQALEYKFHDISLLENALRHSSYANENRKEKLSSNERLEFLGDSVLGFIVAEYLFHHYPNHPEGDLTRMRAELVCEGSLASVAAQLELGSYLKLGYTGHSPLGDYGVIQCQFLHQHSVSPQKPNLKHHTLFNPVISICQLCQQRQLSPLQLGHKPHAAHIDSHYRDIILSRIPGSVQNGSISAKADQNIRTGKLLLQTSKLNMSGIIHTVSFFGEKRQAQNSLRSRFIQDTLSLHGRAQSFVPIRIGTEKNSHPSPSFKSSWDRCTSSRKSP